MSELGHLLADASDHLDQNIISEGPAHLLRIRVSKVMEEVGEVEEVIIGVEASNPRKGRTHTLDDLEGELLDVMLTSALAFYHVSRRDSMVAFEEHARRKIAAYYGIEVSS